MRPQSSRTWLLTQNVQDSPILGDTDMAGYFGNGNGASLSDVFRTFSKNRESGLLLHYWP